MLLLRTVKLLCYIKKEKKFGFASLIFLEKYMGMGTWHKSFSEAIFSAGVLEGHHPRILVNITLS